MRLKLKTITLSNFKGFTKKTINFSDETFIFGENATGKTTILDSFLWLLFGKDSDGRSDFGVKHQDIDGKTTPMQEVEVSAIISIDGVESEFKRVLREKWVKKRGSENSEFQGNETIYFIDDLPLKLSEYQSRVSRLITEELFKLITTPTAFNSIAWADRRKILIDIAGGIDSDKIIEGMDIDSDKKQELLNMLAKDSQVENHKKTLSSKIKMAKEELKMIPTRIDEVLRSIPEKFDFAQLRIEFINKTSELENIDMIIQNESKAIDSVVSELTDLKKKKYDLESEIESIKSRLKSYSSEKFSEKKQDFENLKIRRPQLENNLARASSYINDLESKAESKRKEWHEVNNRSFEMPTNQIACPTCRREFDEKTIDNNREILEGNFNENKAKEIKSIEAVGRSLKDEIEATKQKVEKMESELTEINLEIEKNQNIDFDKLINEDFILSFSNNKEIKTITENIDRLNIFISEKESQIGKPSQSLIEDKNKLKAEIEEINMKLRFENQINQVNERIEQLKNEEKLISQSISSLERTLNIVEGFNNSLINSIESKVNSLFENVKFKMFEEQINGGLKETCLCTLNGVDYSDLNTAAKINSGLEIINVLNRFYDVSAPIFIDNRESILDLYKVDAQIINLIVSKGDSQIRVA